LRQLSRRSFLALAASAAAGRSIYAASTMPRPATKGGISLAGSWRFALDREDVGVKDRWFSSGLSACDRIALPGILQAQGYGDNITAETPFVAALPRDMAWYKLPQYAAYTKPGNVKVPYLSQPIKHYLGVAWYQREIDIPVSWKSKRVALTLERTRWQTTVFLDEKEMGSCQSLVAPHDYDLGFVQPGNHRLTIRIDNRMILPYRPDAHSVSDAEGGTWTGVVGRIELFATSPVWLDDIQVFPNVFKRLASVRVSIGNALGERGSGTLDVSSVHQPVSWDEHGGTATVEVPLPNAVLWDEFSPALQQLTVKLRGEHAEDEHNVSFGLREIHTDGTAIRLNGELLHIRATHDGGGFPLTGYPATDIAAWKRIIATCKEWGMNAIRFHSWCPPEAAFNAADEMGFYLQPDCGMWNSFDAEGKMLAVLNDETARLLKAFGNHPSLVMLNASNEPAGHYNEQLPLWDRKWREADPRRLYADGTGRAAVPESGQPFASDYVVQNRAVRSRIPGRGPSGWFGNDYASALDGMPLPVVGHEVGQWCAYPNFDVIAKFKGYMVPGNYEIWRDAADAHHLLEKNTAMAHASGRFQVACYKEEIEASLRTPGYSGYELLDLHDYLGQGGAPVGVLDAFWENKGYVNASEYRQFNNETVVLARLKERVYSTADALDVAVEVAHFGRNAWPSANSGWKILDARGNSVADGAFNSRDIPRGKNISLGRISASLSTLPAPAQYKLVVDLHGSLTVHNEWNFWLYPATVKVDPARDVVVTRNWTDAAAALANGQKVLFLPDLANAGSDHPKMSTVPIFWNRLMNPGGAWMLGLLCDSAHPALAGFPTESNCDWQWIDVASDAYAMRIDSLPAALEPIVQPIDDWNRSWKLALIFECAVGTGRLLVCSIHLESARAGAASLHRSLLSYMAGRAFQPRVALAAEDMENLLGERAKSGTGVRQPTGPTSPDLDDPGQIHPKSR
jgi:beta-galactosidase